MSSPPTPTSDPGTGALGAWSPQPTGDPVPGAVPSGLSADPAAGQAPVPPTAQPPAQPPVWTPPPVPGRGPSEPEPWEPPPAPERERSPLGQLTVGLALLTAGVVWLLTITGVLAADLGHVLAASLLVIGLGLLVGSVLGRARWLIVVGLILLPMVLASTAIRSFDLVDVPVRGGFGEQVYAPAQVEELPTRIELTAGTVEVDLTRLVDARGEVPLEIRVGAGEIDVLVPEGAGLEVTAGVQVGVMDLLGNTTEGFPGVRELGTDLGAPQPADPGAPTFVLDLRVGAGDLSVSRGPAAPDVDQDAAPDAGLDADPDAGLDADVQAAALLLDLAA